MGALNKVRGEILAQRLAASLRQDPKPPSARKNCCAVLGSKPDVDQPSF